MGSILERVAAGVERALELLLTVAFAGLVVTVFAQVFARNVLEVPLVWTLDAAQLLFGWCIFIGAAVAYRRGGHYVLDVLPAGWPLLGRLVDVVADVAAAVVIVVLVRYGAVFVGLGRTRTSEALGLSEVWFYLPVPLGAAAMGLFLVERLVRGGRRAPLTGAEG